MPLGLSGFFLKTRHRIWVALAMRPKRISGNESDKVKATIRKYILAINYTIAVIICLTLVAQTQIPIVERALYGFGAIFIGMGIRRVVKTLMPLDEDHMGET